MPIYRFTIVNGIEHDDTESIDLPDDGAARQEALKVIGELKRNSARWNGWTMQVLEGSCLVWTIPFNDP
jgi:hypothetical protein